MLFIVNTINLNVDMFNEETTYYVLLEYDHFKGYLKKLASEVRKKCILGSKCNSLG